jgi:endonuclease/exonuclease/phosphatase (EEP) superfamily protein YafD
MRTKTIAAVAISVSALVAAACSSADEASDPGTASDIDSSTTVDAVSEGASGEFTLLAYNVAGLPQEISSENPTDHIPLISPLLEPYDVVLTQEDFDWWKPLLDGTDFVNYHQRLRAETTHPYATAPHPGPEVVGLSEEPPRLLQIGDGQGILSRFAFTDEQRVPWTGCFGGFDTSDGGAGDCLAMKGFAVVTMTIADGVVVDVYTLHVEAGGSEEDQRLQGEDMSQLADFIAEHSVGRAVIVGGDTNLHTDDVHPDGAGGADTVLWADFLAAAGLTDACAATGCEDTGAIDKVAYRSGGGVELEATSHRFEADTFVDAAGEPLSDHDPLAVGFRWSRAGG